MKWTIKVKTDKGLTKSLEVESDGVDTIIAAVEEAARKQKIVPIEITGVEPHNVLPHKS
jgi:hypothetical protein